MVRFELADLSQAPLDELVQLFNEELDTDVRRALGPVAGQHLYVLALCIGEHATSVYITGNSEEHLRTVAGDGDPGGPYLRWDCSGDWAIIEPATLKESNRFLFDLRRAHDAWLWGFDPERRSALFAETWAVLQSRLVDIFHGALRRLADGGLPGEVERDSCVLCLLALDNPDFTEWSARLLNRPDLVAREFGSAPNVGP